MKALVLPAALLLGACGQKADRDCLNLAVYPPAGITDPKQTTYACVEHRAARLARGPDTPDDVARAAVTQCEQAIQSLAAQEQTEVGSLKYNQLRYA